MDTFHAVQNIRFDYLLNQLQLFIPSQITMFTFSDFGHYKIVCPNIISMFHQVSLTFFFDCLQVSMSKQQNTKTSASQYGMWVVRIKFDHCGGITLPIHKDLYLQWIVMTEKDQKRRKMSLSKWYIYITGVPLFFSWLPFDPPENVKKHLVLCFQGNQKRNIGKKWVHLSSLYDCNS